MASKSTLPAIVSLGFTACGSSPSCVLPLWLRLRRRAFRPTPYISQNPAGRLPVVLSLHPHSSFSTLSNYRLALFFMVFHLPVSAWPCPAPLRFLTNSPHSDVLHRSSGEISSPLAILHGIDAISNTICSVIDAADFVRNAHADEGFRNAADDAFSSLAEYIQVRRAGGGGFSSFKRIQSCG